MSQALIDELRRENLCTHFVLPLLKLNKFSFISSNFVNSFLTHDGRLIYVQVIEPSLLARRLSSYSFCTGFRKDNKENIFIGYQIPREWSKDVQMFMDGKFSKMSKGAKERIMRYSHLANRERTEHRGVVTDGRLLALEKHPVLKQMWERTLSTTEEESRTDTGTITLSEEDELLSVPGEESYINLEGLTPIKRTQL